MASSAPNSAPQKWRRPVKQRSRLVRRTGPPHARVEFAHHSEQEFARFLDYYRIRWIYEPMSFPIAWEGTRVSEMFTPDFYLPEQDMYVELTTSDRSQYGTSKGAGLFRSDDAGATWTRITTDERPTKTATVP